MSEFAISHPYFYYRLSFFCIRLRKCRCNILTCTLFHHSCMLPLACVVDARCTPGANANGYSVNTGKRSQLGKYGFGLLHNLTWSCYHNEGILLRHPLRSTNEVDYISLNSLLRYSICVRPSCVRENEEIRMLHWMYHWEFYLSHAGWVLGPDVYEIFLSRSEPHVVLVYPRHLLLGQGRHQHL